MPETTERERIVLLADDDQIVRAAISELLESRGWRCLSASSMREAITLIDEHHASGDGVEPIGVALVEDNLADGSGSAFVRALRERGSPTAVLTIAEYGTIESAVESMRLGAVHYLTKPLVDEELLSAVEMAYQQFALKAENYRLRDRLRTHEAFGRIIGTDPRMRSVFETIRAAAPSRTTVLMTGESGTGKSLVARAIHQHSRRSDGPFVEISCGSIPETLLESELFGHVKGAFTGAHADKRGRFLAADGGTIFLDEINSASPGMQMKLLRVLQDRQFEPVGSTETIEVDVRIVLATNEPLEKLVVSGAFRQDLYYRINVVSVELPPLRERPNDIPVLSRAFLQRFCDELDKEILGFTEDAMEALGRYRFPGNIRELENIIERAVVLAGAQRISVNDLPEHVLRNDARGLLAGGNGANGAEAPPWKLTDWRQMSLAEALREPERQILLAALEAHDWNRQATADALEINRSTLYKKMKEYGLDGDRRRIA